VKKWYYCCFSFSILL